jgi:hypothetical protein
MQGKDDLDRTLPGFGVGGHPDKPSKPAKSEVAASATPEASKGPAGEATTHAPGSNQTTDMGTEPRPKEESEVDFEGVYTPNEEAEIAH